MKPPYNTLGRLGSTALLVLCAIPIVRASDYQTTVTSQGPIGYYRLNETVQPVFDPAAYATNLGSLGAAADGTFVSSPVLGFQGPFSGVSAIDLNGLSQYIRTPSSTALDTTNFTFETWVKPANAPFFAYVASSVDFEATPGRSGWYLAQDDGVTFGAGSAWVVRIFNQNGTGFGGQVAAPILAADVWVHLVVTYDNTSKVLTMYTNGVLAQSVTGTAGANGQVYVPNQNLSNNDPLTIGARSTLNFFWPGQVAQSAVYGTALSAARVAAHFAAATSAGSYSTAVQSDAPLLYYNYFSSTPAPVAANLGTLGTAGNALFLPGSIAAATGPRPPIYPGFAATNTAAAFVADGGAVRIPALNLNTNTVTISAWISATNLQKEGAGLVVTPGGGLIIDGAFGGFGLGYYWNNTDDTFLWSPSADAGLPGLPDSDWAFAALVVQPTEANIYIGLTNSGTITFAGVTNYFSHGNQAFSSATFVGTDGQDPLYSFNGAIDEVAIWKRALSSGELYTQFASAVGGVPATILTDLVGPSGPAAVGDPITLSVNAGGTPDLVYIWYKDSTPIVTITNNNKYTVANATFGDAGTYEVTVTNAFGSATSQQLAVTVVNPTQPTIVGLDGFFSRTLYPTGTLHMAVSAVGGGLTYQWYKNGTAIPAATESAYHVSLVTAADAGSYYVSVTNSAGATNTSSFPVAIAIATVTPGSYEAAIVASGPQAWWRLDETPGATNLIDSVGRHNGTYTNINGSGSLPALGVTGALVGNTNKAVSFDASGGIGLIPNSPQLSSGKFTVEAWVKTSVIQQRAAFSCVDNTLPDGTGWAWLANNANGNYWNPAGPDALNTYNDLENPSNYDPAVFGGYTSAAIGSNVWTHLVLQYDVDRLATTSPFPYTFFINGQGSPYVFRFVNNSAIYDKLSTTAPFVIGGYGDPVAIANLLFNGQVDEVAVYSRLITSAEITNHIVARGIEFFAPQFTAHPVAQTVTVGKRITFSASAQGNPAPVYQWFKGAAPITGATSNTFTIPSVTLADAGSYSLRATNQAGTNFSTAAVLTVLPATAYANVTNGLVLHLKFEGDVQDSSGKGNNGTPSSSPAPGFVAGKVGAQAAQFTTTLSGTTFSSASYVDLGTPTDLLFGSGTSFTVGLWVKLPTNGVPGDVPFIGTEVGAANNDGWFIGPSYQAGGWQWNLNDGTGNFGTEGPANSINDGNWHSFMVTVDRTSAVVNSYLDGLLVASTSISGLGSVDVGGTVTIAQDPSKTYPEAAVFTLDDIGIWRRALTPAEVATIESAGRAGNSFDTVAPPSVTLTISQTGGNIIVGYPSGTLQQSDSVGAGAIWTTVTGASAPSYTTSPTNAAKFYRVLLP